LYKEKKSQLDNGIIMSVHQMQDFHISVNAAVDTEAKIEFFNKGLFDYKNGVKDSPYKIGSDAFYHWTKGYEEANHLSIIAKIEAEEETQFTWPCLD
jgi:hypothetical protein